MPAATESIAAEAMRFGSSDTAHRALPSSIIYWPLVNYSYICCCLFIAVSQCCFAAKPPATFLLLSCHVMARERLAPALRGAIHPATPDWPLHYCTVLFLCSEVGCTVFSCSTVNQSIDNGVVANEGVCVFVCVPVRCAGTFWHCILCSNWNSDGCRQ